MWCHVECHLNNHMMSIVYRCNKWWSSHSCRIISFHVTKCNIHPVSCHVCGCARWCLVRHTCQWTCTSAYAHRHFRRYHSKNACTVYNDPGVDSEYPPCSIYGLGDSPIWHSRMVLRYLHDTQVEINSRALYDHCIVAVANCAGHSSIHCAPNRWCWNPTGWDLRCLKPIIFSS